MKIQFEHDKYDGETLHGCRGYNKRIPPCKEVLINPISIIDETECCKAKRVLVGAVRFANHSCLPNCEFLATEHKVRKCVKLAVIRSWRPGDALTVDYGPHYFDPNNRSCKCDFADRHRDLSSGSVDSVKEASETTPLSPYCPKRQSRCNVSEIVFRCNKAAGQEGKTEEKRIIRDTCQKQLMTLLPKIESPVVRQRRVYAFSFHLPSPLRLTQRSNYRAECVNDSPW